MVTLVIASMVWRTADPLSPIRVFLLIWLSALGLAELKLSGYQQQWSLFSWFVLFITIGSFLIGIMTSHVLWLRKPRLSIPDVRARLKALPIDDVLLRRIIFSLVGLYLVSLVAETAIVGYVPLFSSKPDVARVEFGVFGIHLFVTLLPTVLYLIVEYIVLIKGQNRSKILLAVLGTIVFLSFGTLLQRFLYMTAALLLFAFVFYTGRRIRFRHVLITGVTFIGFLGAIQSIRIARYVQNYIYIISKMKFSPKFAVLTEPYMYIAMNLENYARAVDKLDFHTYGYFSADSVVALSGLKHWLADYFGIVERPFLISGYNTYSSLLAVLL